MSSKRILILSVGVVLLILIGWSIYSWQERTNVTEFRYHVFCEQIRPGMDQTEVRKILSEYGDFRETVASFKGGSTVVGIVFTDPTIDRRFGGKSIVLSFENEKYINAYIPVLFIDANKPVCQ